MEKMLSKHIKDMGLSWMGRIPHDCKAEFEQTVLKANLAREIVLVFILLVIDLVLLFVDMLELRSLWTVMPASKNLFYLHIVLLAALAPYFLMYFCREKLRKGRAVYDSFLYYYPLIVSLLWCTALGVNAQMFHKQISPYIIYIFCVSSIILMKPIENIVMILSSYLIFLLGIFANEADKAQLVGLLINATTMIIFAFAISRLYFAAFANDFMSRRVIKEKTRQLEGAYKYMEDKVRERTEELTKSNMQLVSEISCKYEAELKAAKIELMFREKEKLLKEAMDYDKLRTEFFSNLSHELRTPLNIIFCVQQMLSGIVRGEELGDKGERAERYLGIIRQNCYRLLRMIGNLIDITKIDAGFFEIELGNNDIIKVVEDITLSVAEYIEEKHVELVFDTELEEKVIACDPDKIERVILNLLSNAVKFTPENGNIFVNIYEKDQDIVISVKDTGIGIPEDKINFVFDRFIQIDKSLSRNTEGSGIGLSLVKSLVELHHGKIEVRSKSDEGAEFLITLPDNVVEENEIAACKENSVSAEKVERISIEFSDIYL